MNKQTSASALPRAILMSVILCFVFAPPVQVLAQGITINITAGLDQASSSVRASGSLWHIITMKERSTFGINDDNTLKVGVKNYFGKVPQNVYLTSSTPWGDLYKKNDWSQVQTVLVVKSATITEITSNPVIVKSQIFTNNSSVKATFNASILDQVTNTTETSWTQTNTIEVSQSFSYEVGFLGTGAEGETVMSYSYAWGEGGSNSESVTVGTESGISVELDPNESVKATLSANKGKMKIQIVYMAYLYGDVAVNYNPTYKGHHFYNFTIGSIMRNANLPQTREFTETIEVGYYSNSTVEVRNNVTNMVKQLIHTSPAVHR